MKFLLEIILVTMLFILFFTSSGNTCTGVLVDGKCYHNSADSYSSYSEAEGYCVTESSNLAIFRDDITVDEIMTNIYDPLNANFQKVNGITLYLYIGYKNIGGGTIQRHDGSLLPPTCSLHMALSDIYQKHRECTGIDDTGFVALFCTEARRVLCLTTANFTYAQTTQRFPVSNYEAAISTEGFSTLSTNDPTSTQQTEASSSNSQTLEVNQATTFPNFLDGTSSNTSEDVSTKLPFETSSYPVDLTIYRQNQKNSIDNFENNQMERGFKRKSERQQSYIKKTKSRSKTECAHHCVTSVSSCTEFWYNKQNHECVLGL